MKTRILSPLLAPLFALLSYQSLAEAAAPICAARSAQSWQMALNNWARRAQENASSAELLTEIEGCQNALNSAGLQNCFQNLQNYVGTHAHRRSAQLAQHEHGPAVCSKRRGGGWHRNSRAGR